MPTPSALNLRLALPLLLGLGLACGVVEEVDPDGGKRLCDPSDAELCNFHDDDCDGEVDEDFRAEGGAVPALGDSCDGLDADLCSEGVFTCRPDGTGVACSDLSANNAELCNGADEDCDGEIDEDFDLGAACDSDGDADRCEDDLTVCSSSQGRVICQDVSNDHAERCNGVDDDCDGEPDNGFNVGQACDGPDTDLCGEGQLTCNVTGDGTLCSDSSGDSVETCNGLDDDCNGVEDDGFNVGAPCDGADTDSCVEGVLQCRGDGTGTQCSDTSTSTVEQCNGLDEDCDGTADQPWQIGQSCDGADADGCKEGVWQCDGTAARLCDDTTDTNIELCDGVDNDCDVAIDEDGACCGTDGCQPELGETCTSCVLDCPVCG